MSTLSQTATIALIKERLPLIFPEGTPNRNYCIRGLAASTVFTMLYIGALERSGIYTSPKHIYKMTDEQSLKTTDEERTAYNTDVLKANAQIAGTRWYQDNTRESIRDETLKEGFVSLGVAIVNESIPTTSGKPRYALKKSFAALFDVELKGEELLNTIKEWQQLNLSRSALARVAVIKGGALDNDSKILVTLPNKETRYLQQGPSSEIAKHVLEVFAHKFLHAPFLLWLSESGNKIVQRDDALATKLGIQIDASRHLPDVILVDLGTSGEIRFVFVEIVATDGPITASRKEAFYKLTDEAGYNRSQVSFVTAYMDRNSPAFKKTIAEVAWNSYAWFASEPDHILILKEGDFRITE